MSDPRFGDWGKDAGKATDEGTSGKPKGEAPEPKKDEKAPDTEPKKPEEGKESEESHEEEEAELSIEELQAKIKGLQKDLSKQRAGKRELRKELAEARGQMDSLKAKKELKVEDFETFEAYEEAQKAQSKAKPDEPKVDPQLDTAISDLVKRAEKSGIKGQEFIDRLSELDHFPSAAIITLADRRDAVGIAQWIAENEDSEEAQAAVWARTDIGRMRAFDDIAAVMKAAPKGKQTQTPPEKGDSVKPIPRLRDHGAPVDLNKVSTDDYIAARKAEQKGRFQW